VAVGLEHIKESDLKQARTGLIACNYRAAEWRHKDIELAAHRLLQRLDRAGA
jgi:hypothetical protein